jgi:hypothetical protein
MPGVPMMSGRLIAEYQEVQGTDCGRRDWLLRCLHEHVRLLYKAGSYGQDMVEALARRGDAQRLARPDDNSVQIIDSVYLLQNVRCGAAKSYTPTVSDEYLGLGKEVFERTPPKCGIFHMEKWNFPHGKFHILRKGRLYEKQKVEKSTFPCGKFHILHRFPLFTFFFHIFHFSLFFSTFSTFHFFFSTFSAFFFAFFFFHFFEVATVLCPALRLRLCV